MQYYKAVQVWKLSNFKKKQKTLIKPQAHLYKNSELLSNAFSLSSSFFLEKNMFVFFLNILRQKSGRYVCVQLLQTLNILFENISHETSLCKDTLLIKPLVLIIKQIKASSCSVIAIFILLTLKLMHLDTRTFLGIKYLTTFVGSLIIFN